MPRLGEGLPDKPIRIASLWGLSSSSRIGTTASYTRHGWHLTGRVTMWREIEPDQRYTVEVDGHNLAVYGFGDGDEVLLCLNGGPGLPCDYLRDAHGWLKDKGLRVIAFDQLGTGASARPTDVSLWEISRYVEEVETVRQALGLGRVHLLGHSWGGWL